MIEFEKELAKRLDQIKSKSAFRSLQHHKGIDLSSNDYLHLSHNESSLEAGFNAAKKFGTSSTGSRLLSGNPEIFEEFEYRIAQDKLSESALIFNSGYIANASVLSAFAELDYLLIFDKLNHASMYQLNGISCDYRKNLKRFRHLDYDHLESILGENRDHPRKVIASETVFGMDADTANLKILSDLAKRYGAILYLDEAHATGLYGAKGYGLSTETNINVSLDPKTTIIMGTFSKALASSGAYVACSRIIKEYLIQVSKGFIYSTALSPFCIGVAEHNWNMIPSLCAKRDHIFDLSDYLRKELTKKGVMYAGSNKTNIIPIIFDSSSSSATKEMLKVHQKLLEAGIITSAIRRPTSPTPRIRMAINAGSSKEDIDKVLKTLDSLQKDHKEDCVKRSF